MTTFLFCLHISAALIIGRNAYRRGRSPIVWTLLTLIPCGILVTWPLLYILPRCTPPRDVLNGAQDELTVAGQKRLGQIGNLRLTTNNKSFYVGVTVWVVCLIVGLGSVIGKHSPEALAQQAKQQAEQAELAKAKQIAEAELFERRRKSPQFRKEVAQLALARQFPGECGAEAQFAEVSGGFHVRCSYGETFMVAGGLAMRCVVQGVNVCIGLK